MDEPVAVGGGFVDEPGEARAAAPLVFLGLFVVPALGVAGRFQVVSGVRTCGPCWSAAGDCRW
ncbi:hypothetical protein [Kitasatospora sp. NPDC059327]|uniref:hypothetical protein n=1 Tax=Kitasatospora sp. NPDC059327 TaxID=3346803 RepID=UPI0036C0A6B3